MDVSNKTLGLLLVAAIVVSIGGTFFSLEKLDGVSTTGYNPFDSGQVDLIINSTISIALTDAVIDFGTCSLSGGTMSFDSNDTQPGSVDNAACNGTFPDKMTVENDGNEIANVTVWIDNLPSTVYGTPGSVTMDFKTANASSNPGCGIVSGWTNLALTGVGNQYDACNLLDTTNGADRFDFYVRINDMADTATGSGSMGLTFQATTA